MTDFEEMTVTELEEAAEFFDEHNWEKNKEAAIDELESRTRHIDDETETPEPNQVDQSESDTSTAELRDRLEWFEEQGWESNAERVREELQSAEELSEESDDDLTHAAQLSEDTMQVKVAKFYSTDPFNYGDFEDTTEAEREALQEELSDAEYQAIFG